MEPEKKNPCPTEKNPEDSYQPEDGDYVIRDYGRDPGVYEIGGDFIMDTPDDGDWKKFDKRLKAHMDKNKYWPNVWWEDDHGGLVLYTWENPCPPKDNPSDAATEDNPKHFKPPGRWTHEGTVKFYEKHNRSVENMVEVLRDIPTIKDPYAFAAKIKDYVESTTKWRGPKKKNPEDNPHDPWAEVEIIHNVMRKPGRHPAYVISTTDREKRKEFKTLRSAVKWLKDNKYKYNKNTFAWATKKKVNPEGGGQTKSKFKRPGKVTVKNPREWTQDEIDAAIDIYKTFTGREPENIEYVLIEGRTLLIKLGVAKAITYEAAKHGAPNTRYIHDFDDADVFWDMENRMFAIAGPDLEITEAGIHG